jgi:hypothetical protein
MLLNLPRIMESNDELPDRIFGYASVKSQGGVSCFDVKALPPSAEAFHGKSSDQKLAQSALGKIGFEILAASRLGIAISGPSGAWEELTGGALVCRERLEIADSATQRYVTVVDITGKNRNHWAAVCQRARVRALKP